MSSTASPYTTIAALKAADRIIGPNRVWSPSNGPQEKWLAKTYRPGAEEVDGIREIISNATWDAAAHVDFLKKYGWEAQIKQLGADEFATAGLLDILVEWLEEGERSMVFTQDKTYPGVQLGRNCIQAFVSPEQQRVTVCLKTKTGDKVWLTKVESLGAAEVTELAAELFGDVLAGYKEVTESFDEGIVFPMVDLATKVSLEALVGLNTIADDGRRATVAEAVQQTTLKMNQKGARARAADEQRVTLESCAMPYTFDKPFLLAIERPGLAKPLFVAHVTQEDWKDPGEL